MLTKIIEGQKYDCATAQLLAIREHRNSGDFEWCREQLYRKKSGGYFLAAAGGPASQWAQATGNGRVEGDDIRAFTETEARAWVEAHANDCYEAIFGPVPE
jgi:hypothetical protein